MLTDITRDDVTGRTAAMELARTSTRHALDVARVIAHPWYRCQALATIARWRREDDWRENLREARVAAGLCDDAYQQVAVLAWPIRCAIERGDGAMAAELTLFAVSRLPAVTPPPSLTEALLILWESAFAAGWTLRNPLLAVARRSCDPNGHWRSQRLWRVIVAMVAGEDRALAGEILADLPEGKGKARIARERERDLIAGPRAFFW